MTANNPAILSSPMTALHRTHRVAALTAALACFLVPFLTQNVPADEPLFGLGDNSSTPTLQTGRAFEMALDRNIGLAWQDQHLREGLRKLSRNRELSVVLDRRIDPGKQLTLQLRNITLRELFHVIALEADAELSVLDNVVYVGPPATAGRLRTVLELASSQLPGTSSPHAGRSFELLKRNTFEWNDLDEPVALLQRIAQLYGLKIESIELVPHDLWASATIPQASAPALLLTVLAQFDLSFEWTLDWRGIRIIPMPASPRVERTFSIRRGSAAEIAVDLNKSIRGLAVQARGSRSVRASGTVEQLEHVDRLLHPERAVAGRPRRPTTGAVTFTFQVRNAPLIAFMTKLEEQAGFNFEYDKTAITNAGIDLEGVVNLNMEKATEDELLKAMFNDFSLAFERNGKKVRVFPK